MQTARSIKPPWMVIPTGLEGQQGGSGRPVPRNGHGSQTQCLATHLVGQLVKDGVVVIDVHNLQVDRDLSCPGWGSLSEALTVKLSQCTSS